MLHEQMVQNPAKNGDEESLNDISLLINTLTTLLLC